MQIKNRELKSVFNIKTIVSKSTNLSPNLQAPTLAKNGQVSLSLPGGASGLCQAPSLKHENSLILLHKYFI